MARLSMGGRSLCRASLVFRVRGMVRVLGLGFCVRVSLTGIVSYLNRIVLYTLCYFRRRPFIDNRPTWISVTKPNPKNSP